MLHANWTAYQCSTSGKLKFPSLLVVAGEMRLGSGWLRLDPWILGNPNGSSMESLHRITLALVGVGSVGVGVLLVAPAGVDTCCPKWEWQAWGRGSGTMEEHIPHCLGVCTWGCCCWGWGCGTCWAWGCGTCWACGSFCCGSFCCWHSLGRHGWQGVPKLKGPQAAWQAMAATL